MLSQPWAQIAHPQRWYIPLSLTCLAVRIPGFDPGGPGSTPSGGVPPFWRRKWQPTPVFLPWKSREQRSLADYSPWNHKRVRDDWATKQQTWYNSAPSQASGTKSYKGPDCKDAQKGENCPFPGQEPLGWLLSPGLTTTTRSGRPATIVPTPSPPARRTAWLQSHLNSLVSVLRPEENWVGKEEPIMTNMPREFRGRSLSQRVWNSSEWFFCFRRLPWGCWWRAIILVLCFLSLILDLFTKS